MNNYFLMVVAITPVATGLRGMAGGGGAAA